MRVDGILRILFQLLLLSIRFNFECFFLSICFSLKVIVKYILGYAHVISLGPFHLGGPSTYFLTCDYTDHNGHQYVLMGGLI